MNDNSTSNNSSFSILPFCAAIQQYFSNPAHTILLIVHLLLLATIILLIFVLIRQYNKHRILVHPNLLILFANILLLYLFHALSWIGFGLRYSFLLLVYDGPCDLLTPAWLVPFFHALYFAYTIAFPSFHFAIMLERIRATILADRYEYEGPLLTICFVLTIWFYSLGYMIYVILAAFADTNLLGHPQGIQYLTSKYNADPILFVMIFCLLLVLFTALCDCRIFVLNQRIREERLGQIGNNASRYNLSLNYQLKENALAMRLILPLDISYALLYPIYVSLVIVLRAYRTSLSLADYNFFHHLLNTLLFLHSTVTIFVYIRFVKFMSHSQNWTAETKTAPEHAKIYFKQLESQWK